MELYEIVIGLIICLILIGGFTVYLEPEIKAVSSSGLISYGGIKLFSDASLSAEISHVNWGTLSPGDSAAVSICVLNKNKGSVILGMEPTNWSPSAAQQFLILSWDYSGESLDSNEFLELTLSLMVSGDISEISAFSFDITVGFL